MYINDSELVIQNKSQCIKKQFDNAFASSFRRQSKENNLFLQIYTIVLFKFCSIRDAENE